jgi:hypothetical protein
MADLREQTLEYIKSKLVGLPLDAVKVMMITDSYLEQVEGQLWISNGGVELIINGDPYAFTFHDDSENFGCYERHLESMLEGFDYYAVSTNNEIINDFIGQKITDIEIEWSNYEITDYTGQIHETMYNPCGYTLYFENGSIAQFACVSFSIDEKTLDFKKVWYDPEGNILVAFDADPEAGRIVEVS